MADGYTDNSGNFYNASRVRLGSKQGTGTTTLSDSIANYKMIFITVGYYDSGYTSYGMICLPSSAITRNNTATWGVRITTYETSPNSCVVGFDDDTTLHVHSIYDNNRYVVVYGIR